MVLAGFMKTNRERPCLRAFGNRSELIRQGVCQSPELVLMSKVGSQKFYRVSVSFLTDPTPRPYSHSSYGFAVPKSAVLTL